MNLCRDKSYPRTNIYECNLFKIANYKDRRGKFNKSWESL